jgi:hypothetical protein
VQELLYQTQAILRLAGFKDSKSLLYQIQVTNGGDVAVGEEKCTESRDFFRVLKLSLYQIQATMYND